jgi:hypothetical protein
MGAAFSRHQRKRTMPIECWLGSLKEGVLIEDLCVDGKMVLKGILLEGYGLR